CAPVGFSLPTALTVSRQDEAMCRDGLGRLVRLSLVNEGDEAGRFVLHPLLFIFSRELARECEMLDVYEQRHTEYFQNFANAHRGLSPAKLEALLLTARRLTDNQIADYGFYLSLEPFLQARGYWAQALILIDSILQVAK